MSVAIPGREVLVPERVRRAKDLVDQADALNELGPIEPRDVPHARDHVADGHVHRGLALVLDADRLIGADALGGEALLEPAEGRGDRGILITQTLEQLDPRRGRECARRQPTQGRHRGLRALGAEAQQAVGDPIRRFTGFPAAHDLLREAAEVVDEEDPQADRDRPELADRQRLHLLIGHHHAPQALRVEPAVRVGDIRPGEAHDAGEACKMALRELRELVVVVSGQVVADLAELLVDDREVVDEPFGGGGDGAFVLDRASQNAVRLQQDAAVLGDPGLDGVSPARRIRDLLGGGQGLGMLLQTFHAEELGEDRLFEPGLPADMSATSTRRVPEGPVRGHIPRSARSRGRTTSGIPAPLSSTVTPGAAGSRSHGTVSG